MNKSDLVFLDILRNSIHNFSNRSIDDFTISEWKEVIQLSEKHCVFPLVIDYAFHDALLIHYLLSNKTYIQRAKNICLTQAKKTANFVSLYNKMKESGLYPVVLKGVLCRCLYDNGELRPSADEDLLINPFEIKAYHSFLLNNGFKVVGNSDVTQADEAAYTNSETKLYIELHKSFFPKSAPAFNRLNELFNEYEIIVETAYQSEFYSLNPTDHLLYMILHAYKHFVYSGIGIRQLCDITLFIEKNNHIINWNRVLDSCKEHSIFDFCIGILRICINHLGLDCDYVSKLPEYDLIDEIPLLEDVLYGGLYGAEDSDRLHSSTMTLNAVISERTGKKNNGVFKSIFKDIDYMKDQYPYLCEYEFLLPVAWLQRIIKYLFRDKNKKKNNPIRTIEIGNERISLLKFYRIIK